MTCIRLSLLSLLLALLPLACSTHAANGSDSASQVAEQTTKGPAKATLLFVGDAMQHQMQLDRALELGGGDTYSYAGCFDLIAPTVKAADYAVVNLEVPLGGGVGGYSGYPMFSAPDAFATSLQDAGFDLFLTANNHTLDRHDAGLRRTIHVLDSIGVDQIGTYNNPSDRAARVPFIKDINGIKTAFLNYTYDTNGIKVQGDAEPALIDRKAIAREMQLARDKGAEIVIVCIHWGNEYQLIENANQRSLAQYMADLGVDMVIGSHPHVIQPMKVVHSEQSGKDCLVVYSLGNFISNMRTDDTRGGAMVTCVIERDAQGNAGFKSATYDTLYAAKPDKKAGTNYIVYPGWMSSQIPSDQQAWWLRFDNAAQRIFSAHNVDVPQTKR